MNSAWAFRKSTAITKRCSGCSTICTMPWKLGWAMTSLGRVLDGLALYVSYHFAHEEGLFLRAKYPGYERHRKQHLALTDTVKEIYTEFQSGNADTLPQQVLEFLKTWLYEHIMGADRAFGVYLNTHRVASQLPMGA